VAPYFGEEFKRLFEPGEKVSVEDFADKNGRYLTVPMGVQHEIDSAAVNVGETVVLSLEGHDCGRSDSLSKDEAFWLRQKQHGLRYVAKSDFDGDGFVWYLSDFYRMVKAGDRIIAYVSADVYLAQSGYVLLFKDFTDYVDASNFDQSIHQHGYPVWSLVSRLLALKPSKLDLVIDGTILSR
jgi:hypothetical protein